ncbi:SDR family oxidoreductase [Draconibacterium sp. IB214405]|uniref:SDR family NAD(P)-dependent oxidoreductase n=1 Tax=Draconibacterium sp. IB214405 TaxID=3097352 RepID=UPI002A153647|nr:SDR family oxidoreductase [Draconibacterium sp. IB214405]MDX8341153.1 SDR family oxidoreductase [Draconibacterium sp. IB214405]
MNLQYKTIVVTGGGSGMGRELVIALLKKGAKVAAIDINKDSLEETVRIAGDYGINASTFVLDITDKSAVEETVKEMLVRLKSIDGLINNAGIIQPFAAVNDLDDKTTERVMNVNFWGTYYLTKTILPHLLTRPEAHIVNVSSMGGFIPFPTQTIYGASKAAVKILTEGLYAELKNTAVNVTVVHPGAIMTNITQNSGLGGPKVDNNDKNNMALSPSKAAQIIIRAMEKNKFRATVGKDAWFLDKLYRLAPKFATNFIGKMMKKSLAQH